MHNDSRASFTAAIVVQCILGKDVKLLFCALEAFFILSLVQYQSRGQKGNRYYNAD